MDAGRVKAQIKQFLNQAVHPKQRLLQIKMFEEFLEQERVQTEETLQQQELKEINDEWNEKNPSAQQ